MKDSQDVEELDKKNTRKYSQEELEKEVEEAGKYFSDEKFWDKLKTFAKKAGSSLVYVVLLLYFTLQKPEVPLKVKATIVGSLGYFILPIDLIPDVMIAVGYTDDLGAVGYALLQVAMYVDDDVRNNAKGKLKEWFGDTVDTTDIDKKIE